MDRRVNENKAENNIKNVPITDFISTKYREFWNHTNYTKNAFITTEQLLVVCRRLIYSAYQLNLRENDEMKTIQLTGECVKYHPHGDASINDSLKGFGNKWKSQPETQLFRGIGNYGSIDGGGAASRYLFIAGTPLLSSIYNDMKFFDEFDEEGVPIICPPLPMGLINGTSMIGVGRSAYVNERHAEGVIDWIEKMINDDDWSIEPPKPTSTTNCETWLDESNGATYYRAKIYHRVNPNDLSKKGKYDVITAIPPKTTSEGIIDSLKTKIEFFAKNKKNAAMIVDGSGKDKPIYIILPTGFLDDESQYNKLGLQNARFEQPYVWDYKQSTMKLSTINEIAREWFEERERILKKKFNAEIKELNRKNHIIDIIRFFIENNCSKMEEGKIIELFEKNFSETGAEDAKYLGGLSVRSFYPENIDKNEIQRQKNSDEKENLEKKLNDLGKEVIAEARSVMEKQRNYFKQYR